MTIARKRTRKGKKAGFGPMRPEKELHHLVPRKKKDEPAEVAESEVTQ